MNVGLIGCGNAGEMHLKVYKYIKRHNVLAICDINYNKGKNLAKKYRISKVFTNYLDLVECKDLDLIDICTPPSTHAQIACDAMKFGHNVLVEKPMARSVAECERMMYEAKKRGVNLCIVHDQLFYPSIQKAKAMIASHDITTIITRVRLNKYLTNFSPWVEEVAEGGFLWEECHAVYLQQYFLENIKEVYATGTKVGSRVYNNLCIVLRTPYQSYGIIEVDILSKEQEKSCEIKTSTGSSIEIDLFTDTLFEKARKPLKGITGLAYRFFSDESRILRKYLKYGLKLLRYGTISISHYILINSYLESLQHGRPPPVPPEQGRDTIKLLECIQESLNKQPITVN